MAIQVIIDGFTIPNTSIVSLSKSDSSLSYYDKLISANSEVVLNNASSEYSDMSPVSLFYGKLWYNMTYDVYDTTNDVSIFSGIIKNISQNDNNKTITISANNYMRDVFTKTLVYTSTNTTPSDAIRYILTYAGVPTNNIDESSFINAYGFQYNNGLLVDLTYVATDEIKCGDVINELLKISQCGVCNINNRMSIIQWVDYAGEIGYKVDKIVGGSFSSTYSNELYNKWKIAYKSGANVLYSTGTKVGTTDNYVMTIPDTDVGTVSTSVKMICSNITSANFAGALVVARNFTPKKICNFSTSYSYNYINIGDLVNLTTGDYYMEPLRVTGIKSDDDKRILNFTGEFVNLPVERYSRDITPPDAPIISVSVNNAMAELKITECLEADFDHYMIYFGINDYDFETESCDQGLSPVQPPVILATSWDGYKIFNVVGLQYGIPYYFKATAVDTSGNESDFSNIVSCTIEDISVKRVRITDIRDTRTLDNDDTRIIGIGD